MLKNGDVIQGTITGIKTYGIFLENQELNFKGLVHISECSEEFVKDLNDLYRIGQNLSCMVVDIDPTNAHVSLSIRALKQKANVHRHPIPESVHVYHKFYWTNNENNIGFQSVADELKSWKIQATHE